MCDVERAQHWFRWGEGASEGESHGKRERTGYGEGGGDQRAFVIFNVGTYPG